MKAIRVHVANGRISGQAPPGLADGDVDLCLADDDEALPDDELARLDEALARGFESLEAGRGRPAADVISDLRRR